MSDRKKLQLFEAFGVELEYMIVADPDLSVLPASDQLLLAVAGRYDCELEMGELSWSNELVLHVVELKTTEPARALEPLADLFQRDVQRINQLLRPLHGKLMPTAMHPWMDPSREMHLWPHDYSPVYTAFDRIFDCRGHGWANLQSVHLNLPFANDEQFGKLHAAIRLVLPILPALTASSPLAEGKWTGWLDSRMEYYRHNARRIPSVSGHIVPEPVYRRADYEQLILQRMYDDIAAHDPEGTLQHEWLNARGAIARFDRGSIEIRVMDVQECPAADLAICGAVVVLLRALTEEKWSATPSQQACPTDLLAGVFRETVRHGDEAVIESREYLQHLGLSGEKPQTAGDIWRHLAAELELGSMAGWNALELILQRGPLARRIRHRLDGQLTPTMLHATYGELCTCLHEGRMFT